MANLFRLSSGTILNTESVALPALKGDPFVDWQYPAGKEEAVVHFTLYTRSYCHLCDDMLEALQSLSAEYPFTVELMDVDADESLAAQFDELVPVLFGQKGNAESVQLCNYFLDDGKVRAFLKAA